SADGRRLLGEPVRLIKQDQLWEGERVEAPTMWREGGRLYLFFSGNDDASDAYGVGYARCTTPLGPCTQSRRNPILTSRCKASGQHAGVDLGDLAPRQRLRAGEAQFVAAAVRRGRRRRQRRGDVVGRDERVARPPVSGDERHAEAVDARLRGLPGDACQPEPTLGRGLLAPAHR